MVNKTKIKNNVVKTQKCDGLDTFIEKNFLGRSKSLGMFNKYRYKIIFVHGLFLFSIGE
jgi:hypothetical protein